jgi:hypothetical protein
VFVVISILLQVSCFVALPYISSVSCSHFTCPARPCLCKVPGDVQASCSTIYSLSSLKSFYQSLCCITKFDQPDLEFETENWGREITLCEVTTSPMGRESASWKFSVAEVHAFVTQPVKKLDQIAHKVAIPSMKLAVVSYVNTDPAVELIRFYSSDL